MMLVKEILHEHKIPAAIANFRVHNVTSDTRDLKGRDIFFVIEGKTQDVFSLLKEIEEKVVVFVAERRRKSIMEQIVRKRPVVYVKDVRQSFHRAVDTFYPLDERSIKFIGVTGTNGKTTTTHLIYYFLNSIKVKAALLGTVRYFIGGKSYPAPYTTPGYLYLRRFLYRAIKKSVEYVVMEVSSHGIVQGRVDGIRFHECIFTNLSRDHLDYHGTMKEYFRAKASFFNTNRGATKIVNIDDLYGRRIFKNVHTKKVSYGFSRRADYFIHSLSLTKKGVTFMLDIKKREETVLVEAPLLGQYNAFNITAAFAALVEMGFSPRDVLPAIGSFEGVPGRMEEVSSGIFVDYAHTPDGLNNALVSLRDSGYDRIILVFGCGGDRDKGKRKVMGRIASEGTFFTFITSDNPRKEDPLKICNDIKSGFQQKNFKVVVDRRMAIREAIVLKERYPGSIVLVAGKGHEEYQILRDKKVPFNDREVIEEYIAR